MTRGRCVRVTCYACFSKNLEISQQNRSPAWGCDVGEATTLSASECTFRGHETYCYGHMPAVHSPRLLPSVILPTEVGKSSCVARRCVCDRFRSLTLTLVSRLTLLCGLSSELRRGWLGREKGTEVTAEVRAIVRIGSR